LDWMKRISWVINNNGDYYIKWIHRIWDCSDRHRERECSRDFLATLCQFVSIVMKNTSCRFGIWIVSNDSHDLKHDL
jgi:hypothetical protein